MLSGIYSIQIKYFIYPVPNIQYLIIGLWFNINLKILNYQVIADVFIESNSVP